MIPGGAWVTADRSGLAPLASYLSEHGLAVANATIRGADADFLALARCRMSCAPWTRWSACAAVASRRRPSSSWATPPVPISVHWPPSARSLNEATALTPPSRIDAAALLAGIYDLALAADVAEPLLGTSPHDDPAGWRSASASTWVGNRPEVPVFLAHGDHDELVPESFTTRFATALEQAGHAVQVDIVHDAGHHEIYSPGAVGPDMVRWITTLG